MINSSNSVVGVDRPVLARSMHIRKPLRIIKGNNSELAPSPYLDVTTCPVNINTFARYD